MVGVEDSAHVVLLGSFGLRMAHFANSEHVCGAHSILSVLATLDFK